MARIKGYREQVEDLVYYGYNKGLWQSLFINTSILLLLAIVYSDIPKKINIVVLTLGEPEQYSDIDMSSSPEIQINNLTDSDSSKESVDEYLVNDPAEGEIVSVNLDIDTPIDTTSVKEFSPTGKELMETLSGQSQNYVDPWSDAPSTGLGKSSRKGSGGNGDGAGNGGSKIEKRLAKYRAKTGDVQVSISWDNFNDVDVWVRYEGNGYSSDIGWRNRADRCGGMLDIDCNVSPTTKEPIENIFWPVGGAPPGRYTVYVQRFHQWDKPYSTKVDIRILWDDKIVTRHASLTNNNMIKVFTFTKKYGKNPDSPKIQPETFMDALLAPMPSYDDVDTGPHLFTGQD